MSASCPLLGFRVTIEPKGGLAAHDRLENAWRQFLTERGLIATGGLVGARFEYLVSSEAAQATELDREAADRWLAEREELRAHWLGPVHDLRPDS